MSDTTTAAAIAQAVTDRLDAAPFHLFKVGEAGGGSLETWLVGWVREADRYSSPFGVHTAAVNEDGSISLASGHYCYDLTQAEQVLAQRSRA